MPPAEALVGRRSVSFPSNGRLEAAVYDRERLLAGNAIQGPAVIEESASTTIVEPGDSVTVNRFGHLVLRIGGTL
jgi:N-methylhydantoinase A